MIIKFSQAFMPTSLSTTSKPSGYNTYQQIQPPSAQKAYFCILFKSKEKQQYISCISFYNGEGASSLQDAK
jgi:hypothetical protein